MLYDFPKTISLTLRLKDMLEKEEVEHWFRNDNCFSIPAPDIWLELKNLLDIETDEFDKPIMEFEIKPNEFDMANRAYYENGLSPTITTQETKIAEVVGTYQYCKSDKFMNGKSRFQKGKDIADTLQTAPKEGVVVAEPKLVGGIGEKKSNGGTQYYQQDRVYDSNGIAMCHPANLPTGSYNYLVVDNYRFYQQAYETLQENECEYGDTIDAFKKRVNKDGITPTITTRPEGLKTAILPITQNYRIRKLTPKECWRLMGVKDEDFEKVAKNQSNSSLYHLAGDSIVANVLMAIFKQMI